MTEPAAVVRDSLRADALHLMLMPTEACNFRCTYCYEDFTHGRMQPWVVEAVKKLLEHRMPELTSLQLGWFGGEPLLAADIVLDVLEHVRSLRGPHPQVRLFSDITTNAYRLSPDLFAQLVDLGVRRYQISFDGPRQWHDRKRVLANGRGTFDVVWGNVAALCEVEGEFEVMVRLHLDRDNVEAAEDFARSFRETFGADERFTLFARALSPLGGPHDGELAFFAASRADAEVEAFRALVAEEGQKTFETGESGSVCYASRGNSFLVRADGRLSKCSVALGSAENDVGRLRPDGTVEIDQKRMAPWMRGLWSADADELQCPALGWIAEIA